MKSKISRGLEGDSADPPTSFSETHAANSSSTIAGGFSDAAKHLPVTASSNGTSTGPQQAMPLTIAHSHSFPSATEFSVTQTITGGQISPPLHLSDTTRTFTVSANGGHFQVSSGNSSSTIAPSLTPATTSGPSRLEVGIFDGTHGWLKVRAEITGTGDIATSLTVKAPAVQALHAAVPEIAGYLQSEGINIARLDVHSAPIQTLPGAAGEFLSNSGSGSGSQREPETPESAHGSTEVRNDNQQPENSRQGRCVAPGWRMSSLAPIWTQAGACTGGWLSICA